MESGQAFVIMQIGNPDLDAIFDGVLMPALTACGLEARRVDRHNAGGLLQGEIITFIEESEIIVADLTNERPNCYLEVGYALGCGRATHLILTAREDHDASNRHYRPGGPRVHFDLAGYDILFWSPHHLGDFRTELEKRVHRRLRMFGE